MGGQPVWLVSVSVARDGSTVATGDLKPTERATVKALLWWMLDGVGDEARQRMFRMNITTCLHRALAGDEVARLPVSFHEAPAIDLAGGPVEILWETEPGRPSTRPCRNPSREVIYPSRLDLWVPRDCGRCEPCQGRRRAAGGGG